jgi:hypothetical protein
MTDEDRMLLLWLHQTLNRPKRTPPPPPPTAEEDMSPVVRAIVDIVKGLLYILVAFALLAVLASGPAGALHDFGEWALRASAQLSGR